MFCGSSDLIPHFEKDYSIDLGCYCVEKETECYKMPYNVFKCGQCKTYQTAYLGDLNIIYNYNANAFGTIRSSMNQLFSEFILKNPKVSHLIEIGGGNGGLSELIMEQREVVYEIVDPTYSGSTENRVIHKTFFENIGSCQMTADTLVMSHVFEHFYEPTAILDNIFESKSIQYIYLNFPDLENCIKKDNYHVLNPEHIYYVENQFIEKLFYRYGFKLVETYSHLDHSVFFAFERVRATKDLSLTLYNYYADIDVPQFFQRILKRVQEIHEKIEGYEGAVYIWPCSMHTVYLTAFGLDVSRIKGVLDNSPHKIGSYLYGSKLPCLSFMETVRSDEPKRIILNGGCYNQELADKYPDITFI